MNAGAAHVEINGSAADVDALVAANASYGHFTSLQVRDGAVVGLNLHLQRLAQSAPLLFGTALNIAQLRQHLRQALRNAGREAAASVRMSVYSRAFDRERPEAASAIDTLIAVTPPQLRKATPLRVQLRTYERDLPQVKHLATFGLFWQRREARLAGYDDALFCTAAGDISEGSVWNVGFLDGSRVIWPQAPMLDGISQQVLKLGLANNGIASETRRLRREDLAGFKAAFACNSNGVGTPIVAIDEQLFEETPEFGAELRRCYESVSAETI